MDDQDILTSRFTDINLIAPTMRNQVRSLLVRLSEDTLKRKTPFYWRPFETWRSPWRQQSLLTAGTSQLGPGRSAHQYGLAIDIVPCDRRDDTYFDNWTWDVEPADKRWLHETARDFGLIAPISWDWFHIEHPHWRERYWTLGQGMNEEEAKTALTI